ncbi:hypothetical protein [Actinacidiphila sp. bgisy160]|uniref:hypothetical protein n=1 Tax=Actinacidiphila sp. bgisy160 TaxID=3413796 RepID=UPI003D72D0C6
MIRRALTSVAAALALLAGATGAASADPAVPSWQPQGVEVRGRASTADAPRLKPGVLYRDTLAADEGGRNYALDLDAVHSAYLAVFALPRPGTEVAYGDGIELTLTSTDGTRCDSDYRTFSDDGAARPIGTWVKRTIGEDGPCQEAHAYVLEVTRKSQGTSDAAPWPLQIRFTNEPGLTDGATPGPALNPGTQTPVPASGTAHGTTGGADFAHAGVLGTGVWKDAVLPGQTRFYRVPVGWGQQAWVAADFANADVTKPGGFSGSGVRVEVYNPRWAFIGTDTASYSGEQTSVTATTGKVAYANRYESGDAVSAARFDGFYYVAVSVHPQVAGFVDGAVPVTLRVNVEGAAQPGPSYAGDPGEDLDLPGEPGSGNPLLRALGFAALGAGTVLLLSLAVWTVTARRGPAAASGR